MRFILRVRLFLLLAFCLAGIQSAASADPLSYNYDQMRSRGNCIPTEELDYQLSAEYELGERIASTAFLGPDVVLAIGRSGKLYRCDLVTGEQNIIVDLDVDYTTHHLNPGIYPINEMQILVTVPMLGRLFLTGIEGDIIWEKDYGYISKPIISDEGILLIAWMDIASEDADINRLMQISYSGNETILFEWRHVLPGELRGSGDLICYIPGSGAPYIFDWTVQSPSFHLFNARWPQYISTSNVLMDPENRLIFWRDYDHQSFVQLEPGETEPEIYLTQYLGRHRTGMSISSNGSNIAILTIDENNIPEITIAGNGAYFFSSDLEIPDQTPGSGYYTLYCNLHCTRFMILSYNEIVAYDGENWSELLSDDELQPESVSLSADFPRMAVGTESGILYVLDLMNY